MGIRLRRESPPGRFDGGRAPPSPQQKKQIRTNWSKGEDAKRMATAVKDWLDKSGSALDSNGEQIPLKSFCLLVDIPYRTFHKYVLPDLSKRRVLGKSVGKKPILDPGQRKFVTDVL